MITIKDRRVGGTKQAKDIPVGEVFSGRIGQYPEMIMMRAGGEIAVAVFSLSDPGKHWSYDTTVQDYRPLKAVLTIE